MPVNGGAGDAELRGDLGDSVAAFPVVSDPVIHLLSGSPRGSHPRAPTERSVTVSCHSALTIQSGGSRESIPSARKEWDPVS